MLRTTPAEKVVRSQNLYPVPKYHTVKEQTEFPDLQQSANPAQYMKQVNQTCGPNFLYPQWHVDTMHLQARAKYTSSVTEAKQTSYILSMKSDWSC